MSPRTTARRAVSKIGSVASLVRRKKEPLGAFARFGDLPTELRLMIWNYAMPLFPRIILVKPYACKYWGITRHSYFRTKRFQRIFDTSGCNATASSVPTLLCVNQEARYELLKHYFNPFARNFCGEVIKPLEDLLINYHIDRLFICTSSRWLHRLDGGPSGGASGRWLNLFPPKKLLEIKERDMHAPPTDTLWSTFESADEQHTNTYGCAHGWEFRWLKNFKALEYLAGRGEAINTEDRTNWTRSLYPFIRLADNELFGPQWEEYLLESMGHDTPELRGRWPEWLLKVHT